MIHAVLDTNILVSAGITPGGDCGRIIQAALRDTFQAVVCPGIVDEYLEVLARSRFTRYAFPPSWVRRFLERAEHLAADPPSLPDLPDLDDRLFLGAAQHAGILVTGNLKHFPEQAWGKARVFAPGPFIIMAGL